MQKTKLVYVWSLRNAAADKAGQYVDYHGEQRYMTSPLEYLVKALNDTALGDHYSLEAIIYDENPESARDRESIKDYGFKPGQGAHWFYPAGLTVQGRKVDDLLENVPSSYRALPLGDSARPAGKSDFERRLGERLHALGADVVVLDGLLVILDELVREGADFHRRIFNVHPGITRLESPYERRGAYATLDALYGARGKKVVDWTTREMVDTPVVNMTGASFHYVDTGIDSGEVVFDVLDTPVAPDDTILELRWNNFNNSLFPALEQGLWVLARQRSH
ncbi:N(5)-hydroxyornithine transformylase PvdF [Pseudomonas sp. CFBP 13711]|uniref:N(5)-hydroxyornithine transformylase PvdF n=1 Tax=unclassified Pseudomonas TaxID=196821 RepID=UPI00178589CD|nr:MULTISPECIES: N(5)-hydroxyornithine transformylase PvdF [unclassified Pseudomonas]MBD8709510.1 N(5)-hydroxyornithine transformylase PvdF [Pseudomonas sp. CFBP 13711]MBD8714546.1 N(5)-hydroxyornithine transformylase PvdF [Pseudomonas sp. CFBP 13715]